MSHTHVPIAPAFQCGNQTCLRQLRGFFRLLALGHILHRAHHFNHFPFSVATNLDA
jgi:hypothetical protein